MRNAWTIAAKDFRLLVTNPMFLIIAGLCSCIWSYSFLRGIITFAQQSGLPQQFGGNPNMNIHYTLFFQHISFVNIIFIFAIPALTMRLISEEKKMRTYDLLLTTPITATEIALGKYLAAYGAAITLILISFIYPAGTSLFASFDWVTLLTSYLGLILLAGVYVGVGLFASSLTESVVLSVIMGVLINLILWFISQGVEFSNEPTFTAVMDHLNLGNHLRGFLLGNIKLAGFVFFFSVMAVLVFLTQRVVESARWR